MTDDADNARQAEEVRQQMLRDVEAERQAAAAQGRREEAERLAAFQAMEAREAEERRRQQEG